MTDEERSKLNLRLQAWNNIRLHSDWGIVMEDMEDIVKQYRGYAIAYLTKKNTVDAERQALIAEGIQEVLERRDYLRNYLDSYSKSGIKQKICQLCGQVVRYIENLVKK